MMKSKFIAALLLGAALTASADGYKDGIEYYKAGQYDNAITLLNRNLNSADTDKALSLYYLGASYLSKGDTQKAKTYFEQGVAANPDCAYNYVGLGALALKAGDVNAAKDNFKKAQSLAKKNNEVLVDIARAYYNADHSAYNKEIEDLLKKARKNSKNAEPAIYIFEGDRLADAQQWNEAATQYEQAIYFDQDNPEGYVKYANVYYYVVPDYAISKLAELLQVNPNSALGQRELAEKYYLNGKWTRAAEQYGKYIANPNHFPEDKARYAVLLYAGGKYNDAINTSNEVLATDPNNFQVQRVIVRSYNELEDTPAALKASKAFFSNPAFADRYNASDYTVYAALQMADKDTVASLNTLEKGLKAFPEDPGILTGLSDYYFDTKDYVKSADYGEQAVQKTEKPSRSDYYNATGPFLGVSSQLADDPEKAAAYAKRGIALIDKALEGYAPNEAPVRYLRRKVLLQLVANNSVADQAVLDAANALVARLDAD
ncbi:MAG: tetratricopeptide repeat protein, partial [Bacteroidales bacterium]|nr:tetratricopeptide repeat protein [Bacteroidales bacterium]